MRSIVSLTISIEFPSLNMDSRKKINLWDITTVIFWATLFFIWVFSAVKGNGILSNVFVWILCAVGGGITVLAIWCLLQLKSLIGTKMDEKRAAEELCPHGVIGGRTRPKILSAIDRRGIASLPLFGSNRIPSQFALVDKPKLKCPQCEQDEKEFEQKEQLEKFRQQAAEEIRIEADSLQNEEYTRLTKLRTHKIDFLLRLTAGEFEEVVGNMYRKFGYEVERTPMSNDFGRDLILKKDGRKTFVECKRYDRDTPIGRRHLQLFYGVIVNMHADAGIFVTTSRFANTAVNFAGETGIKLIDGYELAALMAQAFPGDGNADEYRAMCRECGDVVFFNLREPVSEMICKNSHMVKNDSPDSLKIKLIAEAPSCEKCGSKMRLVNGRRGKFWGCSNYPKCRGTQRYSSR